MSYPVILSTIPNELAEAIDDELFRARVHGAEFVSLHEGYAVILEELDEIWEIVRQKKHDRDQEKLRKEFIQLAAMAVKALVSIDNFTGGSV